jgi:hypothetical protein
MLIDFQSCAHLQNPPGQGSSSCSVSASQISSVPSRPATSHLLVLSASVPLRSSATPSMQLAMKNRLNFLPLSRYPRRTPRLVPLLAHGRPSCPSHTRCHLDRLIVLKNTLPTIRRTLGRKPQCPSLEHFSSSVNKNLGAPFWRFFIAPGWARVNLPHPMHPPTCQLTSH